MHHILYRFKFSHPIVLGTIRTNKCLNITLLFVLFLLQHVSHSVRLKHVAIKQYSCADIIYSFILCVITGKEAKYLQQVCFSFLPGAWRKRKYVQCWYHTYPVMISVLCTCVTVQHHAFSTLAKRDRQQEEDKFPLHILTVDGLWVDSSDPELKWQNA